MMKHDSVRQVLAALILTRKYVDSGSPTAKAFRRATREVGKEYAVGPSTISDGCVRRLELKGASELHALVDNWLNGKGAVLENRIKLASDPMSHADIDAFFGGEPIQFPRPKKRGLQRAEQSGSFVVALSASERRQLLALSELEGRSPETLLSELVPSAVVERLRALVP